MSDIPLHSLGRIGKARTGYAPLNDSDAQENSTDMHTGVLRAAAARSTNVNVKGKGKQRERYQDADEFDEEATLLGNGERALEDVEEGNVGGQSKRLQASSRVSGCLSGQYYSFMSETAFVDIEQDANIQ
jgi:phospholipid-translocating ATPase